jgi:hypothetical protein
VTGGAGSGFEALEGLARTVGAALFLVLWPWRDLGTLVCGAVVASWWKAASRVAFVDFHVEGIVGVSL